jgi:hypothetical protein
LLHTEAIMPHFFSPNNACYYCAETNYPVVVSFTCRFAASPHPLALLAASLSPLPPLHLVAEREDLPLELLLLLAELCDARLELGHALLRRDVLAHAEDDRGVVERLVRVEGHASLVAHAEEEEAALREVESHLADELVWEAIAGGGGERWGEGVR